MNRVRSILPLALAVMLAGCGQELTAGGLTEGEVAAVVTDDPGGASANRLSGGGPRFSLASGATPVVPQGRVEVEGSVAIVREDGTEVRLSPATARAEVRIASAEVDTLARDSALAARYTRARLTFTRVQANVTSGLTLGLGVPFTGLVRVDLPTALVVERLIDLRVVAGREHELVIDLNAADWLVLASPLGTVSRDAFGAKVQVRVR
ncbi:MAG: hypothetical protein KY464_03815 [Gemmatimonadetes bacterium]|nr:hypothetical protein [Gemmatimonadota bacterium]